MGPLSEDPSPLRGILVYVDVIEFFWGEKKSIRVYSVVVVGRELDEEIDGGWSHLC